MHVLGPDAIPGDISVPLSSVKWHEVFPENALLGGEELVSAIQAGNDRRRTCLLFFHPGGDPRLSPLAWIPLTTALHEYSTIAYAFPYGRPVGFTLKATDTTTAKGLTTRTGRATT